MAVKTITMTDELQDYMLSVTAPEPDVLRRLREETQPMSNADCQISLEQGRFMSLLVQLVGAKKALEVGVFTGYSSTVTALALPEDGQLIACDINDDWTQMARRYWNDAGVAHKVDLRIAPAQETLDHLLADGHAGTFDFAFIDADKSGYDAYYERALQLLRPGGLIALDNMFMGGRVADPAVQDAGTNHIRALNAKLAQDPRVRVSLVPIADGLTLAWKLQ